MDYETVQTQLEQSENLWFRVVCEILNPEKLKVIVVVLCYRYL